VFLSTYVVLPLVLIFFASRAGRFFFVLSSDVKSTFAANRLPVRVCDFLFSRDDRGQPFGVKEITSWWRAESTHICAGSALWAAHLSS